MVNLWRPVSGNNYNNALNWSLLAVPLAGDGNVATFDNNVLSGPCTVNVASACNNVDFTNYNNTITFSSTLTVSGNVTLGASMATAGVNSLSVNASGTWTSNGKTWTNPLSVSGTNTYTLADNWNVSGVFTGINSSTFNGFTMNIQGNFSFGAATILGTTNLVVNGNTNQTVAISSGKNNLTISSTGGTVSLTVSTYSVGTITWTSGAVTTSGTLNLNGACTINTSTMLWNAVTTGSGFIVTLLSDIYVGGQLLLGSGAGGTLNGFTAHVRGNLTNGGGGSTTGGTTVLLIDGTGTQTWSGNGCIQHALTINKASGTLNITGPVSYSGNTLTYTAGTVAVTGTLGIANAGLTTVFNTNGISWNNINIAYANTTVTLNSLFTMLGTLTINNTPTIFNGSAGFNLNTFVDTHVADTITFQSGNEYIITTAITAGVVSSTLTLKSSTATSPAYLTLSGTATQTVKNTSATDIDSSRGKTIWCWFPTLLRTVNWLSLLPPSTVGTSNSFFN